jgi:phytoene dehydrogenase-like protein
LLPRYPAANPDNVDLLSAAIDAVVVGSGPNGLAAAIRLADAGRSVVVLEAESSPGGAVRSEPLTLPGFIHDTFSSVYPAGAASPVFAAMGLEQHGLQWVHPEACYAHPLPDGSAVGLYRDLDRTAQSLDAVHVGDGAAWRAFVEPMLDHFEAVRATMLGGFPPAGGALKLLTGLGPLGTARFAALLPTSAQSLGNRLFDGQGSRAWLYGSAGHSDMPPTSAGSAIAVAYLNLLGHAVGWPSPAGGAGRLTDALVSRLRQAGGEVRTDALVERIGVTNGRVTAVAIAGGDIVTSAVVIADVMPQALLQLTGDAISGAYRALASRYRYGPATVKVDWALDGPIPWTGEAARQAGTVHVAGDEDEISFPSGPTYYSGSSRWPTPRVPRRARTPPGRTRTGPRPWTGTVRQNFTSSGSRRRSSVSRPAFATASWPVRCWAPGTSRRATAIWSAAMSAAGATR